jgi:hypothetical protein
MSTHKTMLATAAAVAPGERPISAQRIDKSKGQKMLP